MKELSIQLEKGLEQEKFLEDIPDYQRKLKAWEYVNLAEDVRVAKFAELRNFYGTKNAKPDPVSTRINNKVGFPLTVADSGAGTIIYKDIEKLNLYVADILDKDHQLLPSKEGYGQKAA